MRGEKRKVLTSQDVRQLQHQGYRVTEWISTKGKLYVNLVTPNGAPRTRRVALPMHGGT